MRFDRLGIHGAFLITIERNIDQRGFFARTFCTKEFEDVGIPAAVVQSSISFSTCRGTVRGMHFQWPPSRESKLVRCLRGSIFDVLLDLRPRSPSYLRHISVQLNENNRDAVFIPHGVAHGFQTLLDGTEVLYQMADVYAPALANGVRWNDPAFSIKWPIAGPVVISDRDADYPDFDRQRFESELALRAAGDA